MSAGDWTTTIRPAARKVYSDLLATHGKQTGAVVEALEIARRQAEIDQTERDWRERHGFTWKPDMKDYHAGRNLVIAADGLFKSLAGEFGPQRAVHILTALEREQSRHQRGLILPQESTNSAFLK